MKMKAFWASAVVLRLACLADADEQPWTFTWDAHLPSLQLTNVSIEADNLTDAWRAFTAAHLVRCVLAIPDRFDQEQNFVFKRDTCTVSDVLDALCETYRCEWVADPSTGVIWIGPQNARDALRLNQIIVIPNELRWVPMYTGVLEELLGENRTVILTVHLTWLNLFDYAVKVPAGSETIYMLLNQCLVWNPAMTFVVRHETGRTDIQAVYIPLETMTAGMEGARLFWELETGMDEVPDIEELIASMGSPVPRRRWAAQNYRRLLRELGMDPYSYSKFDNETVIRAEFALLMSWIPTSIPTSTPSETKKAIQAALESKAFETYVPDIKLRLIALALATTHEGFYRQGHADTIRLGPERELLQRDPHYMDTHPDVMAAREKEASTREDLLRRMPSPNELKLVEPDFDLCAFFGLYPWIADYMGLDWPLVAASGASK